MRFKMDLASLKRLLRNARASSCTQQLKAIFGRLFKATSALVQSKPKQNWETGAMVKSAPVQEPMIAEEDHAPVPQPIVPPKLNVQGPQLEYLRRGARHESAHVIIGDEIEEDMEWVNVIGKPGEKHSKVRFKYSPESLEILEGRWNGLSNKKVMTKKLIDLATCFVAGHLIENERYPQVQTVSQRIQSAGEATWAPSGKATSITIG